MTIYVIGYSAGVNDSDAIVINTTSRSSDFGKCFSPFLLGPVRLYDNRIAMNVENAWQFSKVYKHHTDEDGSPTEDYWRWAKDGWKEERAHRYPMGKGAKPSYSYWSGEKLGYIEARKKIYIPIYSDAIKRYSEPQLEYVKQLSLERDVYLRDFDGYNNKKVGMSYEDVIHNVCRPMGHAFILAMMVDEYL
jgi:hypothetical protein